MQAYGEFEGRFQHPPLHKTYVKSIQTFSSSPSLRPSLMEVLSLLTDAPTTELCFSHEDEGPFFDLEFALPIELNISNSSSLSLTEEILFALKSSSSLLFSPACSESNSRKSHFTASVIKSATKLRFFMFRSGSSNGSNYKEVLLRCISKIKPLYVRVIKMRFSRQGCAETAGKVAVRRKQSKEKLVVVPRRLRKSRSASSAVAQVCSPAAVTPRHDDSLLQQEDGIQGAIAHCKRSFHSEKGIWASESALLRSMSDPGEDRSGGRGRVKDIRGDSSAIS